MIDLTELGLSKNESKVFTTIVKLGKSSAPTLSKESGVPYGRIYNVLASLEHKGLVKILPEKSKKFIPGDPETLKSLIKKKKKSLESLEGEIDKLKKIYEIKEKEPVEIARGKRNFYKIEAEMPNSKKYQYNIKYSSEYRPEWAKEFKTYKKRGIDSKDLVRVDKETEKNIKKWLKVNSEMREISNTGVAMSIRDDKVILIALIKSNTLLLIRDPPFVKLMKTLFKSYYAQANPIK